MPRLTKIALVLGILAAPAAAFAHPHDDADVSTERATRREAKLDALFAKLDVDKNGAISRAELAAFKPKMMHGKRMMKMKRAKHFRHARLRALAYRR